MSKKRKEFDCIAMKRELQENFYQETLGMTPSELIAHIHRRVEAGPFGELWKKTSSEEHGESLAHGKR